MRQLATLIGRQAGHLIRLVEDLLDVARVSTGQIELRPEPVDLHELAGRCLETLAQTGRAHAIAMRLDGGSVLVQGDPVRLEQVIGNLVDNALKHTPAGGRVTLTAERAGAEAVLRVQDTGQGIREELLPRVFDLFVQEPQALDRSHGGLGLGLTLVKRLVELHGGSVSCRSAGAGRGSEFTVRLPALADAAGHGASAPAAVRAAPVRRRVLVVEDNADARESLRLLLELAGHVVETADDGPTGAARLRAFRPDVAFIDVGLPGIDGYAVARMARDEPDTRGVRLVALTGYGQAEDRRRAFEAGFDLHLTKPVDPDVLRDLLG